MSFGVPERPPCPVCGAPGGNCGPADGHDDRPVRVMFEEWGKDGAKKSPDKESPIMANDVVAQARIFEKVPIPRSKRSSKVLRFGPGQVIPADVAKRLNVKADGTQSSIPTGGAGIVPLAPEAQEMEPPKRTRKPTKKTVKAPTKKAVARKRAAKKATKTVAKKRAR